MKYEWKKTEKAIYLPKPLPELITVPSYQFFTIQGRGNPNDNFFAEYVGVLYSLSYAVKMSPKSDIIPQGYFDYTVYPLEGVWDFFEEWKKDNAKIIDKNELVFNLAIRQPSFVTPEFAQSIIEKTKKKKPHELLDKIQYCSTEDGLCIQMMHMGSYDSESTSFEFMQKFCEANEVERTSTSHREIYIADPRKTSPDKLKTVLRYQVKHR